MVYYLNKMGTLIKETKPYILELAEIYRWIYVNEHLAGRGVLNFPKWFTIPEKNKEN